MLFRAIASSSAGNLYTVECDGSEIAIECGLAPSRIAVEMRYRVTQLDGCLLSHHHFDHARGISKMLESGVEVYASEPCLKALGVEGHHATKRVTPREPFQIMPRDPKAGRWRVLPFELHHDAEGSLGFLVEHRTVYGRVGGRLLYACDTALVPHTFRHLTHIAIECNHSERLLLASGAHVDLRSRILRSHMSLERVLDYLKSLDLSHCDEIWLLHLSNDHADAGEFQRIVMEQTGCATYVAGGKQ